MYRLTQDAMTSNNSSLQKFIETHKDLHLQFCGEYMSQSIYINDINSPDGTQVTNCLKE